jgi:hypothetical protein
MNKKEIQLKRQLEKLEYANEYKSNPEYYECETALLISLQIPFLDLLETQMKVNPNYLLKRLYNALNDWNNEPVITLNEDKDKNNIVDEYSALANVGYRMLDNGREIIKTEFE